MEVLGGRQVVPSGGVYTALEEIFVWDGLELSLPGDYELKVIIPEVAVGGHPVEDYGSSIVKFSVAITPEAELAAVKAALPKLTGVVRAYRLGPAEPAGIATIRSSLSDSILARTLVWVEPLAEMHQAESKLDLERARSKLSAARARLKLDPVTEEVVDLLMAQEYRRLQDWEGVAQIVGTKPRDPSYHWCALGVRVDARH